MWAAWVGSLSAALMLATAACAAADENAPDRMAGVASVIDGDTVEIHGRRIRFFGVDAVESGQTCRTREDGTRWRCGQRAALALADFVGAQTVSCEKAGTPSYGRMVAVCSAGGVDLNAWIVTQGWAIAVPHYSTRYISAEREARIKAVGIWGSDFVEPRAWRAGQR